MGYSLLEHEAAMKAGGIRAVVVIAGSTLGVYIYSQLLIAEGRAREHRRLTEQSRPGPNTTRP